MSNQNTTDVQQDENKLIAERRAKLAGIREQGIAFPNGFRPNAKAQDLQNTYGEETKVALEEKDPSVFCGGPCYS